MAARVGKYLLFETLGEGAFGKVKLGVHEDTGEQVAVKIMDKGEIKASDMTLNVRREVAIMKALRHRNIVNMRQVLSSTNKLYIVMDLVTGGELFTKILEEGALPEDVGRAFFQQLVDGVEYCHRRGVCHRDLKPENLLIDEATGELKITDFGLSAMKGSSTTEELLHTQCGSPNYCAPEIIACAKQGYNGSKVDVWSCGIILFALLAGYLPFFHEDTKKLYRMIQKEDCKFPKKFPKEARELVQWILTKDADRRPSLADVRRHPWFQKDYRGEDELPPLLGSEIPSKESGMAREKSKPVERTEIRHNDDLEQKPQEVEEQEATTGETKSSEKEEPVSSPDQPSIAALEPGSQEQKTTTSATTTIVSSPLPEENYDSDAENHQPELQKLLSLKKEKEVKSVYDVETEEIVKNLVKRHQVLFQIDPKRGLYRSRSFAVAARASTSYGPEGYSLELVNRCQEVSMAWYSTLINGLKGESDESRSVNEGTLGAFEDILHFWASREKAVKEQFPDAEDWWDVPLPLEAAESSLLKKVLKVLDVEYKEAETEEIFKEAVDPEILADKGKAKTQQLATINPSSLSDDLVHKKETASASIKAFGKMIGLKRTNYWEASLDVEKCIREIGIILTKDGAEVIRKRGENKMKCAIPVINSKEPLSISVTFTPHPGKTVIEVKRGKTDKSKVDAKYLDNIILSLQEKFAARTTKS